jgi:hypothetical protein
MHVPKSRRSEVDQSYSNRDFTSVGDQNLLQLHDTGIGANVVNRGGLLDITGLVIVVEDIGESQGLLRRRHDVGSWLEALARLCG